MISPYSYSCFGLQKGDFVIERKDLTNYDSYPIWKIDAGRLIQKFEPFTKDDKMIHKAMSTVSYKTEIDY